MKVERISPSDVTAKEVSEAFACCRKNFFLSTGEKMGLPPFSHGVNNGFDAALHMGTKPGFSGMHPGCGIVPVVPGIWH